MRIEDKALPAGGAAAVEEQDSGGSELAAGMLGLPGFRVLAVAELDGELQVQVETTQDLIGCPSCAGVAVLHDRRLRLVRDLPARGRPVLLCWSKRVWRCRQRQCPQVTWSERTEAVRAKGVLTERARAEVCRRVGEDAVSVAQVATDPGVGWPMIMRAVVEVGQQILDAAWVERAVLRLGVDETTFLIPKVRTGSFFPARLAPRRAERCALPVRAVRCAYWSSRQTVNRPMLRPVAVKTGVACFVNVLRSVGSAKP